MADPVTQLADCLPTFRRGDPAAFFGAVQTVEAAGKGIDLLFAFDGPGQVRQVLGGYPGLALGQAAGGLADEALLLLQQGPQTGLPCAYGRRGTASGATRRTKAPVSGPLRAGVTSRSMR